MDLEDLLTFLFLQVHLRNYQARKITILKTVLDAISAINKSNFVQVQKAMKLGSCLKTDEEKIASIGYLRLPSLGNHI